MDETPAVPYRRIGTILVETGAITEDQLEHALREQSQTGRLLGEILVSSYGVSRVDLADALAAQWEEAKKVGPERSGSTHQDDGSAAPDADDHGEQLAESDLHVLLEEAEAARAELTAKTDELSRRLASLEALVVGVSDALDELRAAALAAEAPHGARRAQRRPTDRAA